MSKRYVAMGLAAAAAAGAVAVTAAVGPAGADERRELVICNWTESGLVVQDGSGGGVNMIGPGCTPAFHPEIGGQVVVRIAGWDRVPHETTWYMPGQNMRLDITGPVDSAQYTPTYW